MFFQDALASDWSEFIGTGALQATAGAMSSPKHSNGTPTYRGFMRKFVALPDR